MLSSDPRTIDLTSVQLVTAPDQIGAQVALAQPLTGKAEIPIDVVAKISRPR